MNLRWLDREDLARHSQMFTQVLAVNRPLFWVLTYNEVTGRAASVESQAIASGWLDGADMKELWTTAEPKCCSKP